MAKWSHFPAIHNMKLSSYHDYKKTFYISEEILLSWNAMGNPILFSCQNLKGFGTIKQDR